MNGGSGAAAAVGELDGDVVVTTGELDGELDGEPVGPAVPHRAHRNSRVRSPVSRAWSCTGHGCPCGCAKSNVAPARHRIHPSFLPHGWAPTPVPSWHAPH